MSQEARAKMERASPLRDAPLQIQKICPTLIATKRRVLRRIVAVNLHGRVLINMVNTWIE